MNTATWYSIAKALHIIGMASWMAGLFYLVRIMVYHAMANEKPSPEKEILALQYLSMEWKAYKIILRPAVVITWSFGVMMLMIQPVWFHQSWMQVKLGFLFLLSWYTAALQSQIKAFEAGKSRHSHLYFRALNEVPTIIMVGIVFLAVFKDRTSYLALSVGIIGFICLIGWGIWRANRGTQGH
ncbi:MAG: CopD family protein [Saprospiraceae bacterium]